MLGGHDEDVCAAAYDYGRHVVLPEHTPLFSSPAAPKRQEQVHRRASGEQGLGQTGRQTCRQSGDAGKSEQTGTQAGRQTDTGTALAVAAEGSGGFIRETARVLEGRDCVSEDRPPQGLAFQLVDDALDWRANEVCVLHSRMHAFGLYLLVSSPTVWCAQIDLGKPAMADMKLGLATAPV
jgi:hypothetical protein